MCHLKEGSLFAEISFLSCRPCKYWQWRRFSLLENTLLIFSMEKKKTHYVYRNFPTYVCLVVQSFPTIVTKKCSPRAHSLHGTLWAEIYRHFPTSCNNYFLWSTLDSRQCFPTEFLVMIECFISVLMT